MSTGLETADVIEPWIYERLTGDPQLMSLVGGWVINTATDEDAPPDVDLYVVFSFVSARDITTVGGGRAQVDCLYQVKAVGRGSSYDPPAAALRRVLAVLEVPATVSTGTGDLTCVRRSLLQYAERESGAQYRHVGAQCHIRSNSST